MTTPISDIPRRIAIKNARAWARVNSATLEPPELPCSGCGYVECRCCAACLEHHWGERCPLGPPDLGA